MLSEKIRRYRCAKSLSKSELARRTGLSKRTIEFIENKKIDNPTLRTIKSLSDVLEVSLDELVK